MLRAGNSDRQKKKVNNLINAITDKGLKRELNEDNFFYREFGQKFVAVVSDGMGGHNAGEVASKLACRSIEDFVEKTDVFHYTKINIKKAVSYSNHNVFKRSCANTGLNGMGATFVLAVYNGKKLFVANLGDSRAYIISNGCMEMITEDHSIVFQLVKSNIITKEEAKEHPKRNEILKAVGIAPEVFPDIFEVELSKGDKLLLCTDGLSNMVDDEVIQQTIVHNNDIELANKKLVELANLNGGYDNITSVLIEI
jgi:protein phosphatase